MICPLLFTLTTIMYILSACIYTVCSLTIKMIFSCTEIQKQTGCKWDLRCCTVILITRMMLIEVLYVHGCIIITRPIEMLQQKVKEEEKKHFAFKFLIYTFWLLQIPNCKSAYKIDLCGSNVFVYLFLFFSNKINANNHRSVLSGLASCVI